MGQRVNIQYSVELSDLEREVNRLYFCAHDEVTKIRRDFGEGKVDLEISGLDKIDSIRHNLAKVDIMLGDIHNIIEGYIRYKTQPASPTQQSVDSPGERTEHELEQIEDRLSRFKEMFNEEPNQESKETNEFPN